MSDDVIQFIDLFGRLQAAVKDRPETIVERIKNDPDLKKLCERLHGLITTFYLDERSHKSKIRKPVHSKFIQAWNKFNNDYRHILIDIEWQWLFPDEPIDLNSKYWSRVERIARESSKDDWSALKDCMDYVEDIIPLKSESYEKEFLDRLQSGVEAWKSILERSPLDFEGILRRIAVVPLVHVPSEVARRRPDGPDAERIVPLYRNLKHAQDAFVLGLFIPSIAMMRAVMEEIIVEFYVKIYYKDAKIGLKELISQIENLPPGVSKAELDRLRVVANSILHPVSAVDATSADTEKLEPMTLRFLRLVGALIEGTEYARRR